MIYWKNIILFGIKPALISKKNLIANLSIINFFLKTRIKSDGDAVTEFFDREIPMVDYNHTCVAHLLSSLDFGLKKDENYYPQVFLKSVNTLKEGNLAYH